MAMSKSSEKSPRGGRPLVEASARLRVSDLRGPFGWCSHDVEAPDGTVIRCRVEVGDATWLQVEHWPAGARWAATSYAVSLIPTPQHLGGVRWRFLCPNGFGPCGALYLPPGGGRLASRQALGLAHASQRQRAPARAAARADRLRRDIGGSEPFRPKGMHAATFARRLALLARMEVAASAN